MFALACFLVGPLFKLHGDLEILVFYEGGKLENLKKKPLSKAQPGNKLNPVQNQIGASLVGASVLTTMPSLLLFPYSCYHRPQIFVPSVTSLFLFA